jgi:hypothetical protein
MRILRYFGAYSIISGVHVLLRYERKQTQVNPFAFPFPWQEELTIRYFQHYGYQVVRAGEEAAVGERQACPEWLGPVNTWVLLERDQSAYTVKQRQYCCRSSFQSRTWVSWWRQNSVVLAESLSFSPNWPLLCFTQITELFSFVFSETKYVMDIWKTELKPRFESHVSCYGDYLWLDKGK